MAHARPRTAVTIPPLQPGRRIEGISAILLPFLENGRVDWTSFRSLLDRTWTAGLTPAVNMDTGYVHLLSPSDRMRVLAETQEMSAGRRFVAGAFVEGERGDPVGHYRREIDHIRSRSGEPILFQCEALAKGSERDVMSLYARVAQAGPPLLAFELGRMFAPFGRIYSRDVVCGLLDLGAFVGLKHSSLDRGLEWERTELRDRMRPEFRIYTGNDLAIDMAFYGSDYLLGLSTFSVEGFALRDRCWARRDHRAFALNDVLQYLGQVAFRPPVPAYRHSAAQFLKLQGRVPSDVPHPASPRRPASDRAVLAEIRDRLVAEIARVEE